MSSDPTTIASILLKSCAMPPVSWPTASIFWSWRVCASAAIRLSDLRHQAPIGFLQGVARRDRPGELGAAKPEREPAQQDDCDEDDDPRGHHQLRGPPSRFAPLGEKPVLLRLHRSDPKPDVVHQCLADGEQIPVDDSGAAEAGNDLGEVALALERDPAKPGRRRALPRIVGDRPIERVEIALEPALGIAIGIEERVAPGEQIAALAGLGILKPATICRSPCSRH